MNASARLPNAHAMLAALHAGFEARGLIFGAPLALALGAAFVPLRKPGKLPGTLPAPLAAIILSVHQCTGAHRRRTCGSHGSCYWHQ